MKLESILISDDNVNVTSMIPETDLEERKVKETIDFKMVTFSLSGKDYAIDIMYVKEIAKAGNFTYVPNTLPFVVGVYNLRGDIIPILDMRIFFNIPGSYKESDEEELQNLLILNVNEQVFGIVVDKIDKVVGIQKSTIQPPHPLFADINIKYISGVVENNKHLYILLDIERIFSKSKEENTNDSEKHFGEANSGYAKNVSENQSVLKADLTAEQKTEDKENQVKADVAEKTEQNSEPAESTESAETKEDTSDSESFNFVVDELKSYGNFFVSKINENWVKTRFEEWKSEKGENSVQIQTSADAKEFLKSFWSTCSNSWWTKEYAENIFKVLPENSAKQIVVWNPGCGSGMETYCLCCVLLKKYPDSKIRLYAQDVDLLSVSNAPMLTVPEDSNLEWLSSYLTETASGAKTFKQQVKDSIMFEYHDCKNTNALPMVDLIFARDLLSLLDTNAQSQVFADFTEKLKGNGVLILGENELVPNSSDFLEHTEGTITAFYKQ